MLILIDLVIPLLGIYPNQIPQKSFKNIYTKSSIKVLFTILAHD